MIEAFLLTGVQRPGPRVHAHRPSQDSHLYTSEERSVSISVASPVPALTWRFRDLNMLVRGTHRCGQQIHPRRLAFGDSPASSSGCCSFRCARSPAPRTRRRTGRSPIQSQFSLPAIRSLDRFRLRSCTTRAALSARPGHRMAARSSSAPTSPGG